MRQPSHLRVRGGARWRRVTLVAGLLAAGWLAAGPARAMSFAEVFAAARANDAQFRAQGYDLEAAQLGVPIARSALLPSANITLNKSEVTGSRQFYNAQNQEVKVQLQYGSPQQALQVRMPLFNQEARARYEQAKVQADAAAQVYRSRGLELIDRVGTAYLQVLLSIDERVLAEKQQESVQAQLSRAEQRFKRGEGTRTEQALAQAALEIGRASCRERVS
jgi:outer membrane protein TolC